ncbi:hypothetical protein JZ751_023300 [Albula glossodonta]|uniref:Uncharacterized protein n=1 Tax=Albula glossodonta TaxID=121402 RepID=A0A8T2NI13_9TELE|nr:hypothetical protein JZ751_023300 [Albula glossodonta]
MEGQWCRVLWREICLGSVRVRQNLKVCLTPEALTHNTIPPQWQSCRRTSIHQAPSLAINPQDWRSTKQRISTPPAGRRKNYPLSDGGFSEDEWDKPSGCQGVTDGSAIIGTVELCHSGQSLGSEYLSPICLSARQAPICATQPPQDTLGLEQDDGFWSRALEDLETCGQSELLREIEVNSPLWIAGVSLANRLIN